MLSKCSKAIEKASNAMYQAIKKNKKILWCGNGGSAADAQHMAAELMGGLISHDRAPIPFYCFNHRYIIFNSMDK